MRNKILYGTAAIATTAALSLAINGIATTQLTGGLVSTPAAAADELQPFEDCSELLDWYVKQALPEVGPYGFNSYGWRDYGWEPWFNGGFSGLMMEEGDMALGGMVQLQRATPTPGTASATGTSPDTGAASSPQVGVENSGTGTNVQEVGVDEPDRAKTNGDLVVHVRGNTLVITDVTGERAREVGTLDLPKRLGDPQLLLSGDTVLVVGTVYERGGWYGGPGVDAMPMGRMIAYPTPSAQTSRVLAVSIADPTSPRVETDLNVGGSVISSRQYGDVVRLVLSTGLPPLDFVFPNRNRTEREARDANREIVRNSTIEDWLPTVATADGEQVPLVACDNVRHPETGAGIGTLSILSLPLDGLTDLALDGIETEELDSTAVTAGGETVYSSADRLYLATAAPWEEDAKRPTNKTQIHAFALDNTGASPATTYVASGEIDGLIKDRWSLDESDGNLRVVVSHGAGWNPTESGITVLRENGGSLDVIGSVRGLGPKEEVKSVRWYDDLAIVVTFIQTDPLYTVDLSDPTKPKTLGELKIRGFSTYLHPIGEDRLIGLGVDANAKGMTLGGQASTFDISDLTDPTRIDTLDLGRHADPVVGWEPRAFTWLSEGQTALTSVNDNWNGRSRLVALRVASDGTLTETGSWALPRWRGDAARTLPLTGGSTVALVTTEVEIVQVPGL